ncbi:hypothetical protein ABZ953_08240 [Streptomyces sp. NPDC046465]|uniref:hypothetical protein n=1 Tax=Streptomyces sp. NPDC046465 TaxID=3155810 RepID=UPI0033E85DF9
MTARDVARDAGLLLKCALTPTASPARLDEYGMLLDRYHADPELRSVFDEFMCALGLRVLGSDRSTGLVLTAASDSPLAVTDTSRWLRVQDEATDRQIYGLALAGAAAWCYPTAQAVSDLGTRRVTAVDVDRLIREQAITVEADETSTEELGEAWDAYGRRKQVAETEGGRLKRNCTVRMCEDVLAMLGRFRLLVPDTSVDSPRSDLKVWRSTDRFRAHVAAEGGPLVRQTLIDSPVLGPLLAGKGSEDGA